MIISVKEKAKDTRKKHSKPKKKTDNAMVVKENKTIDNKPYSKSKTEQNKQ